MEKDGEKVIKVSASTVLYAFLIVLIATIGIGAILAYGTHTEIGQKIAAKISKIIPLPAAIISGTELVYLKDLEDNIASVQQFYQTQSFSNDGLRVDFTTTIGKKRLQIKKREILNKLVEDKIIEILAKEEGVTITQADVDRAVAVKLNEFGTENSVKDDLLKSYGWSMDDFKNRVILPSMYTEALSKSVPQSEQRDELAEIKIKKAQGELSNGTDFAAVVKKYSEGFSRENAGELGWATREQVVPELASALFEGSAPGKNAIIESAIGFHIVEVQDKKKEDGVDLLQLRQIFVAKYTFADWLGKKKKEMRVWVPVDEFIWNKETGTVDFRDAEMQTFEKDERAKVQGDASLMF